MEDFAAALAVIEQMKADRVVTEYAIGCAMAMIFWSEPSPTFDLDVFVLLQSTGVLISLDPIYRWARARGCPETTWTRVATG